MFTRHTSPTTPCLSPTLSGIIGGRDDETDDDFRYRIHFKLTCQSGINEAALRYQLLQLPGIQDVVFVDLGRELHGVLICHFSGGASVAFAAG